MWNRRQPSAAFMYFIYLFIIYLFFQLLQNTVPSEQQGLLFKGALCHVLQINAIQLKKKIDSNEPITFTSKLRRSIVLISDLNQSVTAVRAIKSSMSPGLGERLWCLWALIETDYNKCVMQGHSYRQCNRRSSCKAYFCLNSICNPDFGFRKRLYCRTMWQSQYTLKVMLWIVNTDI